MQGQDQNAMNSTVFVERATTTDACSGVSLIVSIDSRDSHKKEHNTKKVQKLISEIETISALRSKSVCGLKWLNLALIIPSSKIHVRIRFIQFILCSDTVVVFLLCFCMHTNNAINTVVIFERIESCQRDLQWRPTLLTSKWIQFLRKT